MGGLLINYYFSFSNFLELRLWPVISVLFASVLDPGTDTLLSDPEIGKVSIVLRDNTRHNRKVPVDIFYPSMEHIKSSNNQDYAITKFPLICFGHGYLISGKWYENIIKMIVPEGYILAFPASEDGLFPSHKTLAEDMAFVLKEMSRLENDPSFSLSGHIDTMKCLMGHSMGGGALFLAANLCSDVTTAVALAPYNTRPSAIKAACNMKMPVLVFSGSSDCITPPAKHHVPIYNSLASDVKAFISIKGGTHCQMGVSHPKCHIGERISGCREGISQDEQLRILARYIIPWLEFHLKGNKEAGINFNLSASRDTTIDLIQSRPLGSEDQ